MIQIVRVWRQWLNLRSRVIGCQSWNFFPLIIPIDWSRASNLSIQGGTLTVSLAYLLQVRFSYSLSAISECWCPQFDWYINAKRICFPLVSDCINSGIWISSIVLSSLSFLKERMCLIRLCIYKLGLKKNSVISVLPESEPAICKRLRWNNWQIKHVLSPRWARHPKMIEIEAKVLNRYGYIWPSTLQNTVPKADVNESTTCVTSFSPEFTVTSTLISFIIPGTVIIFCNVEIIFIGKKLFKREKQRILHYPSPGRYLTYSWPISYGVSFRVKHRSRFFNIFSLSSKN